MKRTLEFLCHDCGAHLKVLMANGERFVCGKCQTAAYEVVQCAIGVEPKYIGTIPRHQKKKDRQQELL